MRRAIIQGGGQVTNVTTVLDAAIAANGASLIAASFGVAFLIVMYLLTSPERARDIQFLTLLLLAFVPAMLVNVGWWAVGIYFWALLYRVNVVIFSLMGRNK